MEVQRRVVAARRKKLSYVLGDGFLTLFPAFYILLKKRLFCPLSVEFEAWYKVSLKEDVCWYRVWIHLILASILPVVVFSLSISQSGSL